MDITPPPLPSSSKALFRQLSQVSWISVLVAFVGNIFLNIGGRATSGIAGKIPAIFAGLCVIVGVTSGIIALFGVPRHGRKGLLLPALTGIGLWVFLAAIAIPAFNAVRRKALALQKPTPLAPATHDPQASQVRDTDLGLSFDLPEGYQEFAKAAIPPGARFAYVKPGGNSQNSVLLVKPLGGQLPRRHLRSDEVPGGKRFLSPHISLARPRRGYRSGWKKRSMGPRISRSTSRSRCGRKLSKSASAAPPNKRRRSASPPGAFFPALKVKAIGDGAESIGSWDRFLVLLNYGEFRRQLHSAEIAPPPKTTPRAAFLL